MTESQELLFAQRILASAHQMARIACDDREPDDVPAATAAILMHALELATPELSPDGRARLFNGDDE